MPRKSPNEIVLTPEERVELESVVRKYTSPYCDVVRAKIILLASQDLSNDLIAEKLDLPRQVVSKWRKRLFIERLAGLHALPRRSRQSLPL